MLTNYFDRERRVLIWPISRFFCYVVRYMTWLNIGTWTQIILTLDVTQVCCARSKMHWCIEICNGMFSYWLFDNCLGVWFRKVKIKFWVFWGNITFLYTVKKSFNLILVYTAVSLHLIKQAALKVFRYESTWFFVAFISLQNISTRHICEIVW